MPKPNKPPSERLADTIDEFCQRHGISRGTYYNMKRAGTAPVEMRAMGRVLISKESSEAWRRAREAASSETTAA